MTDKPKPLTKAEYDAMRSGAIYDAEDVGSLSSRMAATLDAQFQYRERTRGMGSTFGESADDIAAELGIE